MRIVSIPLFSVINSHIIDYPTPSNFNYLYNFGSTAGAVCLLTQLITGILLAMHYSSHVDIAFNCIEHIIRDVNNG
jgi:ubiquinol-cytochrome c reductase cytochrome b subunit